MNYRHHFHAGNFADVVKHVALVSLVRAMAAKDKPFLIIDTHGGAGMYQLAAVAGRSREAEGGIGRFAGLDPATAPAAAGDWLTLVRRAGAGRYPGSPWLARQAMRPIDRLVACELHPATAEELAAVFARDLRTQILAEDGYRALRGLLPPRERRALLLIDPPFEAKDEFAHLIAAIPEALRRLPAATIAVWRPIKDIVGAGAWLEAIEAWAKPCLRIELAVAPPVPDGPLTACALDVINPPWRWDRAIEAALPFLAERLAPASQGSWRLDWLVEDR